MLKRIKKTELKEAFLSLSEEEMFKYFEIFKKNPFWYSWKEPDEYGIPTGRGKKGGKHEFLMKLRASKLKDDALIRELL